ncbi:MAG: hypothetical protein RLY93_20810, partial [Sumerlaeia bacterium]
MNPTPANISTYYEYDERGNVTRVVDGRGVATDFEVNQLDQVVQVTRAAATGLLATNPAENISLTAFAYVERIYYDANDNVVLRQVEDRGNTSDVDGDLPSSDLAAVGLSAISPDFIGGTAFADSLYKYDLLNNRIETVEEVAAGEFIRTKYRYDNNEHRVLTIYPEGNADAWVYDERDKLFQSISGASTAPADGNYYTGDPTTFNRPGGSGTQTSTITYSYDGNGNLVEAIDSFNNGGNQSSSFIASSSGDVTKYIYDAYNRRRQVTDPMGNTTHYTYDPEGKVIRVVKRGQPDYDLASGGASEVTLSATEMIYDERDRLVANHDVLFKTPTIGTTRTPTLTDSPFMDSFVSGFYLSDAASDTAAIPGFSDATVIGRLSTIYEYDRNGRVVFQMTDDLNLMRTDYDGAGRVIRKIDSALWNGTFSPILKENGINADEWGIYDATPAGATISAEYDPDRNSDVIFLNSPNENGNGYVIGDQQNMNRNPNGTPWNATEERVSLWYKGGFTPVYVMVSTSVGEKFVMYYTRNGTDHLNVDGHVVIHLGNGTGDDTWRHFDRNVKEDFEAFSTGTWQNTDGILFRASDAWNWDLYIDDIKLSDTTVLDEGDGNEHHFAYDDNGNLIEEKNIEVSTVPELASQTFRQTHYYDALNRPIIDIDSIGRAIYTRYDSRGNIRATADAVAPSSTGTQTLPRRGLGSTSNVTVNGAGNVILNFYDGLGRLVESETLLSATGMGNGTNYGADVYGVLTTLDSGMADTAQGGGDGKITISQAFDDNSQMIAKRDDNGNVTAYIYDNQERLLTERQGLTITGTSFSITGGDSGSFHSSTVGATPVDTETAGTDVSLQYDLDSNITQKTDEAGNVFTYTYDGLSRRTGMTTTTAASGFHAYVDQTYRYDGLGRTTRFDNLDTLTGGSATTFDSVVTRVYDSLSRLLEETQKIDSLTAKVISYNYDVTASTAHNVSSLVYPDGRQTNNSYDRLGRLIARRDNGQSSDIGRYDYIGGRVAALTYQNDTRLTHFSVSSGAGTSWFDDAGRVLRHRWESYTPPTDPGQGTLLAGYEYQDASGNPLYDGADNRLIEYAMHDPDRSERFTYDSAYRLTSPDSGTQSAGDRAYERGTFTDGTRSSMAGGIAIFKDWDLDGANNWSTFWKDGTAQTRTHSDFNEIVGLGSTTLVYDANGNLLDDATLALSWDVLNRLRAVHRKSDGLLIADYQYDATGRRVRKVITNGGKDADSSLDGTTDFYYDGWQLIEERDAADTPGAQYAYGNYLDEIWVRDDRDGGSATIGSLNDGSG